MNAPFCFLKSGMLVAAMLSSVGCKESATTSQEQAPAAAASASHEAHEAEAATSLSEVLTSYERIRSLLAEDQVTEVSAAATALKNAARDAASKTPAAHGEHVRAIAAAADTLAATPTTDEPALRRAFGEVSRSVVALIAADPKLAEGKHLFECPMTDGYKRWVQTSAEVSNPYMGKKMATCGTAVSWR